MTLASAVGAGATLAFDGTATVFGGARSATFVRGPIGGSFAMAAAFAG